MAAHFGIHERTLRVWKSKFPELEFTGEIVCERCKTKLTVNKRSCRQKYCAPCRRIIEKERKAASDAMRIRKGPNKEGRICSCCGTYAVGTGLRFLCNRCYREDGSEWMLTGESANAATVTLGRSNVNLEG
jgi:hypothetical protein